MLLELLDKWRGQSSPTASTPQNKQPRLLDRLQPLWQAMQPNRNQASAHPAWGADVERAFNIFRRAERGDLAVLYTFYDDLYDRDTALQNQVNIRRDAIASLPVDIQSGDPDDARANEVAQQFRRVWRRLDWESLLSHHQFSALFYGLAATEMSWALGPEGTWDPVAFHHVRSHAFRVAQPHNVENHPAGALLVRTARGYEPPLPNRWVITQWDELRAVASNGLMRASSVLSIIKSSALADWIRLIKRHGLPFLQAVIDDWSDEQSKAVVRRALANLGEVPGILVPKSAKAALQALQLPPVSGDAHTKLVEYFERAMAKHWNGAQLITEVGGSAGNYTVANNHRDARFALLAADKRRLERSFGQQIVQPWLRVNNICDVAPPRIDIGLAELQYATEVIGLAKELHQMGIPCDPKQLLALVGLRPQRDAAPDKREAA